MGSWGLQLRPAVVGGTEGTLNRTRTYGFPEETVVV